MLIVVSGPYSHSDPLVKQGRVKTIANTCVKLCQNGDICCSPLLAGLSLIEKSDNKMPDDYEFWKDFCRSYVEAGDVLYVLDIQGWEDSTGVQDEIECARSFCMPVYLMEPDTLEIIKQL